MKKLFLGFLIIFSVVAFSITTNVNAADKKMAGSGGLGLTFPIPGSDLSDSLDYAIPLLLSFQYAVIPNVTIEGDFYYDLLVGTPVDYSQWQIGVSGRYWITKGFDFKKGKAYQDIYIGAGLASTKVEVEMPSMLFFSPGTADERYNTFLIKGGYVLPAGPILVDLGFRYDLIDFPEFEIIDGAAITLYGMACLTF